MSLMIVVQAHVLSDQLFAQIDAFLGRGHFVILSVDGSTNDTRIAALAQTHERLIVQRSLPVTWCGLSIVTALLNSFELAIQVPGWSYLINISGHCLLYKPLSELETYIETVKNEGVDALIPNYHSDYDLSFPAEWAGWENSTWLEIKRYCDRAVDIAIPESLKSEWLGPGTSPVVNAPRRFAFHATDDFRRKTLIIRPLFPFELRARQSYVEQHGLKIGRAWFVMADRVVRRIIDDGPNTVTWSLFRDAFLPDEYFIHNLVDVEFPEYKTLNYNLHVGSGGSVSRSMEEINGLSQKHAHENVPFGFFIRKAIISGTDLDRFRDEVFHK